MSGAVTSGDVIGPCLSSWLMAIGHRLSRFYFFCSPALSSQVSHWSSTLRHRIIYCCQDSQGGEWGWGVVQEEGRQEEDVLQRKANGGNGERQACSTVKSQPLNI